MPRRQLLSPSARAALFDPPTAPDRITRLHTLSADDLALVGRRRRPENRIGFAVQLAYLRHPGRALGIGERPPPTLLTHLAAQVGVDPMHFDRYGRREETRREHLGELLAALGLVPFGLRDYRALWRFAVGVARGCDRGEEIAAALVEEVRARRVLLPAARVIERLGLSARARARQAAYRDLIAGLAPQTERALLALLEVDPATARSGYARLRDWSSAPSAANLVRLSGLLTDVRVLGVEPDRARRIHAVRYGVIAAESGIMVAQHVARLGPERRLAVLTACVLEQQAALADALVDIFDRMMGALFRRAERAQSEVLLDRAGELERLARIHAAAGRALAAARTTGADAYQAIEEAVGWEVYLDSVARADAATRQHQDQAPLREAVERFAASRRAVHAFLRAVSFRSHRTADPLLRAIDWVRDGRTGTESPAVAFLPRRWRPVIMPGGGPVDPKAYAVAVLALLRDRLRAGDVWVEGSRSYRQFSDYLLPRVGFEASRDAGALDLPVPIEWPAFLAERRERLDTRLRAVAALAAADQLPDARIDRGRLIVTPLRTAVPDAAKALRKRLYGLLPRVRITELLAEVDAWTGFAERFSHVRTGEPAPDTAALLGAVLADATNLGLSRMAESSRGLSLGRLVWAAEWHLREETYKAALAALVDAQQAHPMASLWGPGDTSSSDGQFFRAGGRGEAGASVNARYGDDPGVLFYSHVSDRYAPFHTKVISATAGEAAHVLDGLLMHGAGLRIREHYTDTAGATDLVFGICVLLGFGFAPRIRDLADRRLYVFDRRADHGVLEPLVGGRIDVEAAAAGWDELLWLAASLRTGTVAPSAMLRRLAAFPRQNGMANALREVGRIERTLFALDWISDADLRRRSTAGLNKGEAEHALKRAVFFHRLGELRDRTLENQGNRASGLNLVTAAIVLWNTVYLARAVEALEAEGEPVPTDLLVHVAPLGWEHIALTGDYVWSDEGHQSGCFRPLRRGPELLVSA